MAVNEKPVYATSHTMHGGHRFGPGSVMNDGRIPEYAWRSAMENGLASDSPTAAKRAEDEEKHRRADVADQIENRSEKRDFEPRADRRY
jgi:hypothetical protein